MIATNNPAAKIENTGLASVQLAALQNTFGKNEFVAGKQRGLLAMAWDIIREPMFLILILASALYFILGEVSQGLLMFVSVVFVAAISFYQEVRSTHALDALRKYTQPMVVVIRDGRQQAILSTDLLPGDVMILEEGNMIPADAVILHANDLSVNESILTGEAVPVEKNGISGDTRLFQGTTINSGKCRARVTSTGNRTELGKLGKSIGDILPTKTALQQQINLFVRIMALIGVVIFVLLGLISYLHSRQLLESLLLGLTFAMAIIPEEIPVAFTSFMALGAYHMARFGIITREPLTIENLGDVTVICLDKTGTITENRMTVQWIYDFQNDQLAAPAQAVSNTVTDVLLYGRLASEKAPFDAMEKAIVEAFSHLTGHPETPEVPDIIHEYPLGGHPPMMTHIYEGATLQIGNGGEKVVAGKGAPERILSICRLSKEGETRVRRHIDELGAQGYRVLGVCSAPFHGDVYPSDQDAFDWQFKGLLALYDPPKPEVREELACWLDAGIDVKLVTGDFPETARTIATLVGLPTTGAVLNGDDVMAMPPAALKIAARSTHLFTRMFPEAKLKLIDALKASGEIVAMMGDGVNDGPALRSAQIGIAMGGRGTEIARRAADLILTDDNLAKVTEAIRQGRKIYYNLKKAIRYIISIHVPIMIIASVPLLLNWKYPNIFTPIHIIFLELIMGPTCSVFFEKEPVESHIMEKRPRRHTGGIFTTKELAVSFLQGAAIAAGILIVYFHYMQTNYSLPYVRTLVFITLVTANVFLTFINRSFEHSMLTTFRYKNPLAGWLLAVSALFLVILVFFPPIQRVFGLVRLSGNDYLLCLLTAIGTTWWFDLYKILVKQHSLEIPTP